MSVQWLPKGIRGWVVALAALLCMALTARLGLWQLDRAAQKNALQNAVQQQSGHDALDNAGWRAALPAAGTQDGLWLHRPVRLAGRWQPGHTVYLDNRQMHGQPGFFVLTPLLLDGGGAVLVQRGWVPRNFQDRTALPAVPTSTDPVLLHGRIAPAPSALFAMGGNAPDSANPQILQNLDLPAYARETGLALPVWTVVQIDADAEGLQRDWPVPDHGVAKHYGYAVQWFGLCALVAALYLWFQWWRPWWRARTAS